MIYAVLFLTVVTLFPKGLLGMIEAGVRRVAGETATPPKTVSADNPREAP
jgi:hypothetical protein